MLLVWTFYTYSWFHLELQQVEGGFLVGAVHAESGQPVLARGREDVGHNFFLAVNPENVDGLVLHKYHSQGVIEGGQFHPGFLCYGVPIEEEYVSAMLENKVNEG